MVQSCSQQWPCHTVPQGPSTLKVLELHSLPQGWLWLLHCSSTQQGPSSEALSWVFPLSGLLLSHICISHFHPSLTVLFRSLLTSPQMPSLSSSSVLKPTHPSLQEIPLSVMPCWSSAPRRVRTFRGWNPPPVSPKSTAPALEYCFSRYFLFFFFVTPSTICITSLLCGKMPSQKE